MHNTRRTQGLLAALGVPASGPGVTTNDDIQLVTVADDLRDETAPPRERVFANAVAVPAAGVGLHSAIEVLPDVAGQGAWITLASMVGVGTYRLQMAAADLITAARAVLAPARMSQDLATAVVSEGNIPTASLAVDGILYLVNNNTRADGACRLYVAPGMRMYVINGTSNNAGMMQAEWQEVTA